MEERRRYIRFNVMAEIKVQVAGQKDEARQKAISGVARNISVEGVYFTSENKFTPATNVKLEVSLPSEPKPLHLDGEVRWCKQLQSPEGKTIFGIGVKLFTIDRNDESKFVAYVCDRMTERLSQYLHL